MDTGTLASPMARADVETVVGAPMSYWHTVAWRLRGDPTTIVAGVLLLLIACSAILGGTVGNPNPPPGHHRPPPTIFTPAPSACAWRRWGRPAIRSAPTSRAAIC
jgi:hypothetical protein